MINKATLSILVFLILISSNTAQNTVGLILNNPESFPGYTLFSPNNSNSTFLIDNDGLLVNQWVSNYSPSLTVYLLEDGSLLRASAITSESSPRKGGFQKFSWEGELLWEFYFGYQHHDIEPMPNGNVLMVVTDLKTADEAIAAGRNPALLTGSNLRSLSILEIQQIGPDSGSIVWEWHAWDHLIQDFNSSLANFGDVSAHPELIDINFSRDGSPDWLHTNSVAYNPIFDQIVVSNRGTNDLWILDHSTTISEAAEHTGGNSGRGGDILYRWGNPQSYAAGDSTDQQLFAQHDAHWIRPGLPGAGNMLIFNNGSGPSQEELPAVDEIVLPVDSAGNYEFTVGSAFGPDQPLWTYFDEEDSSEFIAPSFGGSQRLENGNTLIISPENGRLFEVTPSRDVVWIYINPVSDIGILTQGDEPYLNKVPRCTRYSPTYPGLIDKDLTPGDPIELYPASIQNGEPILANYYLSKNFPNPFNSTTAIQYFIPEASSVVLTIFDIAGRELVTLSNQKQEAGLHTLHWNGTDHSGIPLKSGLYLYTLDTGKFTQTRKMLLLK